MKEANYFVLVIFVLSLTSCEPLYESYGDGGMYLTIVNRTEKTYTGKQSLYIGAVKDNLFYITDSISSYDTIQAHIIDNDEKSFTATDIKGIQDWRPKLSKIDKISNNGVFLFKIPDGKQLFFKSFNFPIPALDGSALIIRLEGSGLLDPEDLNGDIRQDYEIIK
jgi:hypothetical protein